MIMFVELTANSRPHGCSVSVIYLYSCKTAIIWKLENLPESGCTLSLEINCLIPGDWCTLRPNTVMQMLRVLHVIPLGVQLVSAIICN